MMEALAVVIAIGLVVLLILMLKPSQAARAPEPRPSPTHSQVECTIIGSVSSGKTLMLCSIHKALEPLAQSGQVKGTTLSDGINKRFAELQGSGTAAPTPPAAIEWLEARVKDRPYRFQAIAGEDLYNNKGEMSAPELLARHDGPGKVIVVAVNPFVANKALAMAGMNGLLNASLERGQTLSQGAAQAMRVAFSVSKPNPNQQRSIAKLQKIDTELQSRELGLDERGYITRNGNTTSHCIRPILDDLVNTVCGEATSAHLNVLRAVIADAKNPCVATTHMDLLRFVKNVDSNQFRDIAESLFGDAREVSNHQIIVARAVSMTGQVEEDGINFSVSLLPEMGAKILSACEKVRP